MSAVLALRDMIPIVILIISIILVVQCIKTGLETKKGVKLFKYCTAIYIFAISIQTAIMLVSSNEGWHPINAFLKLAVMFCQGCDSIVG